MTTDRLRVGGWALGLGILTGAVAGSLVSTSTPASTVRILAAFGLVATAGLAVVLPRRWDAWSRHPPVVRFAVFFLSLLVATVAFDGVATLLVGDGPARQPAEVVAVGAGVVVAVWAAVYGGAERLWFRALDWLDVDW